MADALRLILGRHMMAAGLWLGAMAYSLAVVQPRAGRFLGDDERYEAFAAALAAGARHPVLTLVAVLGVSGVGRIALDPPGSALAWALVAGKAALLIGALAVFSLVTWRLWPQRLFALPAERPAIVRCFTAAAWSLFAMVAAASALGGVLSYLGG